MIRSLPRNAFMPILAATTICLAASCGALAQTPYEGDARLRVGDRVEATYLGDWKKGEVVGVDTENGRYKIHFDGEQHCNGHVLDTFIARQWVRPLANTAPAKPAAPAKQPPAPAREDGRPGAAPKNAAGARGPIAVGEEVLYTNGGAVWLSGAKVEAYDPAKRTYRLRLSGGSGDILPCHSVARPGRFDNSFYIGKWAVFVSGALTTFERNGDLYRRYSSGKALPPLEIRADGTYIWREQNGKTRRGVWKPRAGVPGITLIGGADGRDWAVNETTEGISPTATTRDEIRFRHLPTDTGYYMAYRIGPNKSCVLAGRQFPK